MTDRHSTDLQFPEADAAARSSGSRLDEDLGGPDGVDVTTTATIPVEQVSSAHVVAREDGALAGIPVIAMVFDEVARRMGAEPLRITTERRDGDVVSKGDVVAELARLDPGDPRRRAHHAQHRVPPVRDRDAHLRLGATARGHRRDGPRHPQDHPGPASAREVRRARRRWHQQADGPLRRRHDQGQPQARRRLAQQGVCRGAGARSPTSPSRWRSPRLRRRSSRSRSGRGSCCATTCLRSCCARRCRRCGPPARTSSSRRPAGSPCRWRGSTPRPGSTTCRVGGLTHSSPILDLALDLTDG